MGFDGRKPGDNPALDIIEGLRAELAAANEVIDRLVKTEHEVAQAIGDQYLLDPPDGGDVKLLEGVERIKAELAAERERVTKLREALEFYAEPTGEYVPDFYSELDFGSRARAVLEETE